MLYDITIVIVNYKSFEDTISYVEALLSQKKVNLNIVIVDNQSPNDSYTELKTTFENFSNIHVLQSGRNGGYSFGNNVGLKYVEENELSELVIISNNDIQFNGDDFLNRFIKEYLKLPDDKAFVSPVMIVNGEISQVSALKLPTLRGEAVNTSIFLLKILGHQHRYQFSEELKAEKVDCLPGSFFMGSLSLFKKIEFFDERLFLFGEEKIIGQKIKKLNLQNYLVKKMEFIHNSSQTINREIESLQILQLRNKSKIYYWKKYQKLNKVFLIFLKYYLKMCEFEHRMYRMLKQ